MLNVHAHAHTSCTLLAVLLQPKIVNYEEMNYDDLLTNQEVELSYSAVMCMVVTRLAMRTM